MKFSIELDQKAIAKLSEAQAIAVSQTASELLSRVRNEHLMPFDTGALQNEGSYVDDSEVLKGTVSIIHDTPYARRVYYNPDFNFNTSKNPNAGGEWWEDWINGHRRNEPKEIFKKLYKRASGGYVG